MKRFNMRVYGILVNDRKEILLSDEHYKGLSFTKFPGGGVCMGESLPTALKREFMEECGLEITVKELLHLTDILVPSAFDDSQVIGAYYLVKAAQPALAIFKAENVEVDADQSFHWVPLSDFSDKDLHFEMDKHAWRQMKIRSKLFTG